MPFRKYYQTPKKEKGESGKDKVRDDKTAA